MQAEIEETQRQIRRSAELIQSAFEGLTALHHRVTEASAMRAHSTTPTSPSRSSLDSASRSPRSGGRNAMDPGHDAILLSSPARPEPPANSTPMVPADSSLPRRSRTSNSTLTHLRAEILMSTESVRQRANELDELRRAIVRHTQERQRQPADPSASPGAPPSLLPASGENQPSGADHTMSTESVRERAAGLIDDLRRAIAQHAQERPRQPADSPALPGPPRSQLAGNGENPPSAAHPTISSLTSSIPPYSRRLLLESSLRQRTADDSATSLGAMVAARTSSPSSATRSSTRTILSDRSASMTPTRLNVTSASSPSPARSSAAPIPAGIASRLTRLAQEIQQDISRISQQSESLMSWINEHRARLDAAPTLPSSDATDSTTVSADSTPRPSHATLSSITSTPRTPGMTSRIPSRRRSHISVPIQAAPDTRSASDWGQASAVSAHPMPARPRRQSDSGRLLQPRGLRTAALTSTYADDDDSDGPLTRRARTDVPPVSARVLPPPSASAPSSLDASSGLPADSELADAVFRVRGALARARLAYRAEDEDSEEEESRGVRSYRVRRRLNADGNEEVLRVPIRRDSAVRANAGRRTGDEGRRWLDWDETRYAVPSERMEPPPESDAARRFRRLFFGEDDGDLDMWARETTSARAERVSSNREAEASTRDDPVLSREEEEEEETATRYLVNLRSLMRARRPTRQVGDTSGGEDEYERTLAAMRARALALTSANPPARTLDDVSIPPPPPLPGARPFSLMSTTQTTPSSLWNDSSVRVRLRAAVARLDEDMRALDAARERAYSFTQAASQPQPAPPPSGAARPPRPLFWPLDGRDVASPSPPPERPSRAQGAPDLDATAVAGDVERAMWGSPTPFYPSPLPLPLVQEMNSLEARSKVFGGAKKVTARLPRRRTLAGR